MKKLFSSLIICSLFLFSCSQDSLLSSSDDSGNGLNSRTTSETNSVLSLKYKNLGWGIDMTGNYLSFDLLKGPVIDISKIETLPAPDNRIIINSQRNDTVTKRYYGKDATEYIKDATTKLDVSFGGSETNIRSAEYNKNNPIFSNTISKTYMKRQSYSAAYTFVGYDKCFITGESSFSETNSEILRNYLDAGFLYSLEHNNAETLVNEYGTHVIVDYILGGRLSLLYKSQILKISKETIAKAGADHSFGEFGIKPEGGNIQSNLVKENINSSLKFMIYGGAKDIYRNRNEKDGSFADYSTADWSNSINSDNSVFLEAKKVIPIYDLVADPTKKAELKIAVENHIKKNQVKLLQPLYHGFKSSKYNDNFGVGIEGLEYLEKYKYSIYGVECYIQKTQTEGTIPLYHGFKSSKYNDNFMAGSKGLQDLKDSGYDDLRAVGYIFEKQITGTVPLYNGWKRSKYNNTLGTGDPGLYVFNKYGYSNIGILGYVYPAESYWE